MHIDKRAWIKWGWVILLLVCGGFSLNADEGNDFGGFSPFPKQDIRTIIEAIINGRFDRGDSLATLLVKQHPEHPWGYFYKGAIIQARMIDRNHVTDDVHFWRWMQQTITVAQQLEQRGEATPIDYFYKGSAFYYMAFHYMKLGNWWQAYRYTRKGVHILETVVKMDSSLWEAYLGIGAYKFWKSKKAGILRFLFLVKNEKEMGLQLVHRAVQKARLIPELAKDQLVYMLLEENQPLKAWQLAKDNLRAFPESRFFLWTYAKASFAAARWAAADSAYRQIWKQIHASPHQKRNFPHVLARLTCCACELGKVEEARQWFEKLQQVTSYPDIDLPEEEIRKLQNLPCLIGHVAQ